MRIEQLEYLVAIARLGSFRRAAEELHISQPALSGSVRSLERELGVDVLERGRHGARMSDPGRDLFPYIRTVLDAVDRLRAAADEQHRSVRVVRVGTVNAATVPLLTPTIREFRRSHPATQVEVIGAQQAEIHRAVLEGNFDLGLVNYLDGDDRPPELETTLLLTGHPVVCLPPDSPLADRDAIRVSDLLAEPLIVMRSGYVMHRYRAPPAARAGPGVLLLHRRCRDGQADGGRGPRADRAARLQRDRRPAGAAQGHHLAAPGR